jgi:hypothetical protein
VAIALVVSAGAAGAQTRRALLIGIDLYEPAGTSAQHPGCAYSALDAQGRCALGSFDNLDGAVNDAQAMADVLTGPKYGFAPEDVVLLTNPAAKTARPGIQVLPAAQTGRDGILTAMQRYLVDEPRPGDTVVFYDASHGSLRVNTAGDKLTLRTGTGQIVHVDSTLVPSDAYQGGYDIRDREMTRIFNAALNKGVHLTVIFDSCHSGGLTRGAGGRKKRTLPYDPRPVTDADAPPKPTEREDNPALVFSAVQQDQSANETEPTADDPEVHGAFTAALVETLQVLPADAPASLVYQRVKAVLEGHGTDDQDPELDAGPARRQQPLFGFGSQPDSVPAAVRAAALKTDPDGSVLLDLGTVSGVGPGSELTASAAGAQGRKVKLRVSEALGIARSRALVVEPAGAKVAAGTVFELTKFVPAETHPLRFWIGPSNLSGADLARAVEAIHSSGIDLIADPAEEPYTAILRWDGSAWALEDRPSAPHGPSGLLLSVAPKAAPPKKLGATLTAAALKAAVPGGAKVWVDLPPSRELAAKLTLGGPNSEAQPAERPAGAQYVLAGVLAHDAPAYAWFHTSELAAGPHPTATSPDHTPGCSTASPYPVRSDWVALAGDGKTQNAQELLPAYAARLARVHAWLELSGSAVAAASQTSGYRLQMVHLADTEALPDGEPVRENERFRLALQADAPVKQPRWVYVLDIDCQGKGTLLYPRNYTENRYPWPDEAGLQIVLRHAPTIRIGPPFGIETLVLLTTAQPLADPYVLDFEGVAHSASRGTASPLERLLSNASSGTRGDGDGAEVPTDWGIQRTALRSLPDNTAQ